MLWSPVLMLCFFTKKKTSFCGESEPHFLEKHFLPLGANLGLTAVQIVQPV